MPSWFGKTWQGVSAYRVLLLVRARSKSVAGESRDQRRLGRGRRRHNDRDLSSSGPLSFDGVLLAWTQRHVELFGEGCRIVVAWKGPSYDLVLLLRDERGRTVVGGDHRSTRTSDRKTGLVNCWWGQSVCSPGSSSAPFRTDQAASRASPNLSNPIRKDFLLPFSHF